MFGFESRVAKADGEIRGPDQASPTSAALSQLYVDVWVRTVISADVGRVFRLNLIPNGSSHDSDA